MKDSVNRNRKMIAIKKILLFLTDLFLFIEIIINKIKKEMISKKSKK